MKNLSVLSILLSIFILNSCQTKSQDSRVVVEPELQPIPTTETTQVNLPKSENKIQVVFLLDATGSMSGLIGTAKEKIWSIVGSFSQAEPTPEIEVGMLFYRDRGDQFITKVIPLGTNMDDLYEQLMLMQADGGGDSPESVNQALYEAVTQTKWDLQPNTYRAIFLVGDCPPHMDYQDDVKYPKSCELAKEKDIIINTILMGNDSEARGIWKEIAQRTNGEFIQTDMNVNNISVSTPYDKEISELQYKLDNTRIYYGSEKEQAIGDIKKVQSLKFSESSEDISARRAEFNMSWAGKASYYGTNELTNDIINGKNLSSIPKSELPKDLQKMSDEELNTYVEKLVKERKELEKKIVQLNKQRQEYIDAEVAKMDKEVVESSFDDVIFNAVKAQAEEKSIVIDGKAKR